MRGRACLLYRLLALTRVVFLKVKVKVKVKDTLRLAVYRQSDCLSVKSLETNDQRVFFQLNPCDISPYVTTSLMIRWVCLL
jgi:hypothetical protein